jgi:hypothetical protein
MKAKLKSYKTYFIDGKAPDGSDVEFLDDENL